MTLARRPRSWTRVIASLLLALILLGVLVGLSDLSELARRAAEVRWAWLVVAGALALVSYASAAEAQRRLLARLGHALHARHAVPAILVAMVANRNLRSGGVTGMAALSWLLAPRGVPASSVVTSAMALVLATNTMFGAIALSGILLASTGTSTEEDGRAIVALTGAAAGFVFFLVTSWAVLGSTRARRRVIGVAARAAGLVGRIVSRPAWGESARGFLERATADAVPAALGTPAAWLWAALRLGTSVAALLACFLAVGEELSLGVLLVGYTAGKVAGILSIVPAGLGVIDGSLVAVFHAFGIAYEAALLAVLLNRVAYHLVPAVTALLLVRGVTRARAAAALESSSQTTDAEKSEA